MKYITREPARLLLLVIFWAIVTNIWILGVLNYNNHAESRVQLSKASARPSESTNLSCLLRSEFQIHPWLPYSRFTWKMMSNVQVNPRNEPSGFPSRCDWVFGIRWEVQQFYGRLDLPPRTIFIHAQNMQVFNDRILPCLSDSNPVVLIIGDEDTTSPKQVDSRFTSPQLSPSDWNAWLQDKRIIHIFVEHLDTHFSLHSKVTPIPLGFNPDEHPSYNPDLSFKPIPQVVSFNRARQNITMVFTNRVRDASTGQESSKGTGQWAVRGMVRDMCQRIPHCYIRHAPVSEYQGMIQEHPFLLCVHGGGIDPNPNIFQALRAGIIPIIAPFPGQRMYDGLPIIVTDGVWNESSVYFSQSYLSKKLEEFAPYFEDAAIRAAVLERLTSRYWWYQVERNLKEYYGSPWRILPKVPNKRPSAEIHRIPETASIRKESNPLNANSECMIASALTVSFWEPYTEFTWVIMSNARQTHAKVPFGFASHCDWVVGLPALPGVHPPESIVFGNIAVPPRSVFVHVQFLKTFNDFVLPCIPESNRIVLIIGGNLNQTQERDMFLKEWLKENRILHLFVEDISKEHRLESKMTPLPRGLHPYQYIAGTDPDSILRGGCDPAGYHFLVCFNVLDSGVILNAKLLEVKISVQTKIPEWNALCIRLTFCTLQELPALRDLQTSSYDHPFTLCFSEVGSETSDQSPCAFKALLAGVIPVITSFPGQSIYEDLPVVVVEDEPNETSRFLSKEYLSSKLKEFTPYFKDATLRAAVLERLTSRFWWEKVQSVLQFHRGTPWRHLPIEILERKGSVLQSNLGDVERQERR